MINAVQRNTETLLDASKEVDLIVSVKRNKYMFISRGQNAGQNHNLMMYNKSCESVVKLKYLGHRIQKKLRAG
jgi:hypothetical protein